MSLSSNASRGVSAGAVTQLVRLVTQVTSLALISRLLSPEDIGLVAMVTAVVGVSAVLQDLGLSSASIQSETLSDRQRSNLFWINSGLGLLLAIVIAGSSPLLADLYGRDEVQSLAIALAPVFLLAGVATQFQANLSRAMNFRSLAYIEISAQLLAVTTAILLSLLGAGPWALVAQQLTLQIALTSGYVVKGRWRITVWSRSEPMRGLLTFGAELSAVQILNYLSRNVYAVILGVAYSAATVGLYNRASQLITVPVQQISAPATRVALPILARLTNDSSKFERYIVSGQTVLLLVTVLPLSVVISVPSQITEIALGDQWTAGADIVGILALGALIQCAGYANYWLFLSFGKTRINLFLDLVLRPATIIMMILGLFLGETGVAAASALGALLTWIFSTVALRQKTTAPLRRITLNAARFVSIGLGSAVLTRLLLTAWHPGLFPTIAIASLVIAVVFSGCCLISSALRRELKLASLAVRSIKGRKA